MSQFLLFYYQNNNDSKKAANDFICVADDSFLPFFVFCLVRSVLENPSYVVRCSRLVR